MNTPLSALPLSAPVPDATKKKRVLLIDISHAKRDLRVEVLRKLGMDVDCAADIAEARVWCARRITAVRSASVAHTQAMRGLPPSPRVMDEQESQMRHRPA